MKRYQILLAKEVKLKKDRAIASFYVKFQALEEKKDKRISHFQDKPHINRR